MDKVSELKAFIFDVLAEQDRLKVAFTKLEELKKAKLTELAEALKQKPSDKGE